MSFGVAYGLALQGLGQAQITSNLLPPEIAKQVVWRKKTPWFYGAAAAWCCRHWSSGAETWPTPARSWAAGERPDAVLPGAIRSERQRAQEPAAGPPR